MQFRAILAGVAVACVVAGCATTPRAAYVAPQVLIKGGTAEQAKMTIVSRCIAGGGVVTENTAHQLVCSKPMPDSFAALMFRAMFTPQNATKPDFKARYTFVQSPTELLIAIDMSMAYQNAFGQTTSYPMQSPEVAGKAQAMLNELKQALQTKPAAAAAPVAAVGATPTQQSAATAPAE
jgi:hypothetical protein